MVREIVTLVVVLSVVGLFVWYLRRAGEASRTRSTKSVQERVAGTPAAEAARPPRERKRKRMGGAAAQRRRAAAPAEPEKDDDDDEGHEADAEPAGPADEAATEAFRAGLAKTRGGFVAKLGKLFGKKKIDVDVLPDLEEVLFTADIGPRAADRIFESVKKSLAKDDLADASKIWSKIRETSTAILDVDAPALDWSARRPFVLLVLGVNGVGKTTTIGKLAALLAAEGKKVLLAAGDTFRAAAAEQLEVWAKRANCPVVRGKDGGDPSSVIFDAVKRGVDEQYDLVICDTAGRLHTKVDLMDELKKVRRVIDKAMPGAPHETWMVLDATTGQNAITQAKTFKEAMEITGIVITKLDGSAKGGVILGICDELKVPVRYIGVGEKLEDLRPFDPAAFVAALYDDTAAAAS
ncbi:MAG: signal recognition particle-docking protein FtsY [Myxococcales bacterium]|nr:signal recognition particle-docking protein FtsY [Myxococcales bacterium]